MSTRTLAAERDSYRNIVSSSSLIGGAQVVRLLAGAGAAKVAALALGPAGVGTLAYYQSIVDLAVTISGFGVASGAVRAIADADARADARKVHRTALALKRALAVSGALGGLVVAASSHRITSVLSGQSGGPPSGTALLGVAVAFTVMTAGMAATMQGLRRIRQLAWHQVVSAVTTLLVGSACYVSVGANGIVPAIAISSLIAFATANRLLQERGVTSTERVSWSATANDAATLLAQGSVFLWNAVLAAAAAVLTRVWIIDTLGGVDNGLYQAAWALSGAFASFVLQAMAADFYPRAAALADSPADLNRLANEQTEAGVLLALPGLVATIVLAPFVIALFYAESFRAASDLLPWLIVGVFGRAVSWPLAYILLARRAYVLYGVSETVTTLTGVGLTWVCMVLMGIEGVAVAFAAQYALYLAGSRILAGHVATFSWSRRAVAAMLGASAALLLALTLRRIEGAAGTLLGVTLTASVSAACAHQLARRLGSDHWLRNVASLTQARLGSVWAILIRR